MKSVLISIQPKYCELIANGKKTVEVRKTKPKELSEFKHECDGNCLDTKTKKKCDKFSDSLSFDRFECDRLKPITRPPMSWMFIEGM